MPRAAVTGADRPLPSLSRAAVSMAVRQTPFREPAAEASTFPTPLVAKLAISVQLSRPLGGLPEPDRGFIDALLAETLDRDTIAARVREHFNKARRG